MLLFIVAPAFGQVSGQVLKIGFQSYYRTDCWTPMLVQLSGRDPQSKRYQIQVVQEDLDSDRATYQTSDVLLPGSGPDQPPSVVNYWIYFRPKPTGRGLPDASTGGTLSELGDQLKVFLCDDSGKQLQALPLTTTISAVDPPRDASDVDRARRMILLVSDGNDQPHPPDYTDVRGAMEDAVSVQVSAQGDDLPSNIIGYEAVDTIVWLDADTTPLTEGTNRSLEAIREWVRQGGHLVVCEPSEPFKLDKLADLLPVKSIDPNRFQLRMESTTNLSPLLQILDHGKESYVAADWDRATPPMSIARAQPTSDAIVEQWIAWPRPDPALPQITPYLARRAYGSGCVSWVAQDLGDKVLTFNRRRGWPVIWDRVLGLANRSQGEGADADMTKVLDTNWPAGGGVDLGTSINEAMKLTSRSAYLITVALGFFIVYWVVAGPGLWIYLKQRDRAELSWYAFGVAALAATLLTALIVRLVVRGPPVLQHLSTLRVASDGGPAVGYGDLGLYIPRDGDQTISLAQTASQAVDTSFITPFPEDPQFLLDKTDELPAYLNYIVNVHDGTRAPSVVIPYRSTLKKLQAKWVGPVAATPGVADGSNGIDVATGSPIPTLVDASKKYLRGTLVNHTGRDLTNIYLAFRHSNNPLDPSELYTIDNVYLVWLDHWDHDATLDLSTLLTRDTLLKSEGGDNDQRVPGNKYPILYQRVGQGSDVPSWESYWYFNLRDSDPGSDSEKVPLEKAIPMMSFFELLSPMVAEPNGAFSTDHRTELFRRGGRMLDMSPSVLAGQLVIVAQSDGPTMLPLLVDDEPPAGTGTCIFQRVLPLDRSALYTTPALPSASTTRPTEPANSELFPPVAQ